MKLYVAERGTPAVLAWVEAATRVVTVRVAYAEARAAMGRLQREGLFALPDLRRATRSLDEEWSRFDLVEVTDSLVRRAGSLAERHALPAYDALHLAAALEARPTSGGLTFASFDLRLNRAAERERLILPSLPDAVRERPRTPRKRRGGRPTYS